VVQLRCFPARTPMDQTVAQIDGGVLVVSQFTLLAELSDGNRPGFVDAEVPARAEALYSRVAARIRAAGLQVATGEFGAPMAVELVNDGPVTFVLTVRNGRVQRRSGDRAQGS
jgi:D-aminoacyl-tRNA deacylase